MSDRYGLPASPGGALCDCAQPLGLGAFGARRSNSPTQVRSFSAQPALCARRLLPHQARSEKGTYPGSSSRALP